ncbi:uncharacterized protein LOC130648177 [Hydractinia symbiolongicarpus]|uniref:uncharacterized protein LOC130648177 n=1 Tax=Hydractinia symbiolongicarpus TaxID=13093 RepID=UPI00254B6A32|nr:uncharacterized protein LOC130648177 [Hydractinia symbiolongicarpus]
MSEILSHSPVNHQCKDVKPTPHQMMNHLREVEFEKCRTKQQHCFDSGGCFYISQIPLLSNATSKSKYLLLNVFRHIISLSDKVNMEDYVVSDEDKKLVLDFYKSLYSNTENLSGVYDDVSSIYDKVNSITKYAPFKRLAKDIAEFLDHKHLQEKRILDVGCGNGNLGKSLVEEGFKNIDGLDISEKLLEMCKETKCYNKLLKVPLTSNPTPGIEENTYDIAVSSGCYVASHIPLDTLFELTRIVKPGGYIFYTLHDPNYTMDYMNWHGKIMKEKKADLISMTRAPYRLEPKNDFKPTYGYYVLFKVL